MGLYRKGGRLSLALATGVLCVGLVAGCTQEKAEVDPLQGYRVAIVDLPPLMELHPSFSKLEQMNDEISSLQEEKAKIQAESREKLIAEGGDEMEKAIQQARKKLEAEQAAVEGELSALSSSLSAQIESEMKGLHASYEAELKAEVEKVAPQRPTPTDVTPPPIDAAGEGQVRDYLQNLSMVRERNLAAKRLELEKRVGDEIAAKKAEVDGQIAAFEADLSAKYQSERLNLQLSAQNSSDEETKTAAENRLAEITAEIDQAKQAKRAELEGSYAAVRAEKTSALQGELEAYQRTLDAEVSQKLEAKRRELGVAAVPQRPQQQQRPSGPPPEVAAKIKEIEGRMRGQLESKKAALQARMQAKMAESRARLEAKQAEVQASLEKLNAEIGERIEKGLANLPEEVQAKLKEIDANIEKIQEERKLLADSMRLDIDKQVAGIAEKKNQTMVLGLTYERNYFYKDPSFEDLTELSQVRVQQMEKK